MTAMRSLSFSYTETPFIAGMSFYVGSGEIFGGELLTARGLIAAKLSETLKQLVLPAIPFEPHICLP